MLKEFWLTSINFKTLTESKRALITILKNNLTLLYILIAFT